MTTLHIPVNGHGKIVSCKCLPPDQTKKKVITLEERWGKGRIYMPRPRNVTYFFRSREKIGKGNMPNIIILPRNVIWKGRGD